MEIAHTSHRQSPFREPNWKVEGIEAAGKGKMTFNDGKANFYLAISTTYDDSAISRDLGGSSKSKNNPTNCAIYLRTHIWSPIYFSWFHHKIQSNQNRSRARVNYRDSVFDYICGASRSHCIMIAPPSTSVHSVKGAIGFSIRNSEYTTLSPFQLSHSPSIYIYISIYLCN